MIIKFKLFERRVYTDTIITNLSNSNQRIYNNKKFKIGDLIKITKYPFDELSNEIYIINTVDLNDVDLQYYVLLYPDDLNNDWKGKWVAESNIRKISELEKQQIKYNL